MCHCDAAARERRIQVAGAYSLASASRWLARDDHGRDTLSFIHASHRAMRREWIRDDVPTMRAVSSTSRRRSSIGGAEGRQGRRDGHKAGSVFVAVLMVVDWTSPGRVGGDVRRLLQPAEAERARHTGDADGDGIYCESLPGPCIKPGDSGGGEVAMALRRPQPQGVVHPPPGRSACRVQPG